MAYTCVHGVFPKFTGGGGTIEQACGNEMGGVGVGFKYLFNAHRFCSPKINKSVPALVIPPVVSMLQEVTTY